MSAASPKPKATRGLRVAVFATDPKRRRELVNLVVEAGHDVAASEATESVARELEAADIVLADGAVPATRRPVVTLGAEEHAQAGALPRDASPVEIDAALRAAAAGLTVRRTEPSTGFAAADENHHVALLTPREMAILSAIAAGLQNKAIARNLDISMHTVKFHVESLLRKLNARTRAEAVAKGVARRVAETIDV